MSELIMAGINLMVMGMSTVVVFLAVLVIGTRIMSQIIMRLPSTIEAETKASVPRKAGNNEDMTEIAAVAAAVRLVHDR
ncbi:MAG: OadG family protein [Reinekea sp.]|jgi:oxaloacetate decarboxylase (Na+ extruding) subunit gamma